MAIFKVYVCIGIGNPLQYSCLENPVDGGAWQAVVHGVTESDNDWSDLATAAAPLVPYIYFLSMNLFLFCK